MIYEPVDPLRLQTKNPTSFKVTMGLCCIHAWPSQRDGKVKTEGGLKYKAAGDGERGPSRRDIWVE